MEDLAANSKVIGSTVAAINSAVNDLILEAGRIASDLYDNEDYGSSTKKIKQLMGAIQCLFDARNMILGIESDMIY